jgi:hypothetical protein
MKRVFLFLIVSFAFGALNAAVVEYERMFFDKPFIYSPHDAIRAYEGTWEGSVTTSLYRGETLNSMKVTQTYAKTSGGALNSSMSIFSQRGDLIMRGNFKVYVEGDNLVIAAERSPNKFVPIYVGETKSGAVLWSPYYPFLLLDSQTDSFMGVGEFARMYSDGFKYSEIPNLFFRGLIQTHGTFSRTVAPKKSLPAKPLVLDKNYFKK